MSEQGGFPDLSSIISRVTENPQALAMLSTLLGNHGKDTHAKEEPCPTKESEPCAKSELPVCLTKEEKPNRKHEDKRRLLLALKPFLTQERRQALDTILIVWDALAMLPPRKEPPCT